MKDYLINFVVADRDFYAPLDTSPDRGEALLPSRAPEQWTRADSSVWTYWHGSGLRGAEDGWKVHVSARPDRLAEVLDLAAEVFFALDVPFKHLSTRFFHRWLNHKHASRAQAGKFIAGYPKDVAEARHLMERLSQALAGEQGPYILNDRRFGRSRTVHYRYGAYVRREKVRADGTRELLVKDGHGRLAPDLRGVSFHLPDGVTDPFTAPVPPSTDVAVAGTHAFNGYAFDRAIRHSNGGGTYQGRQETTDLPVFIKEARAHAGVDPQGHTAIHRLRTEAETLRALHELAPGLAPEPIDYFRRWEHEFLVTEYIDGIPLNKWLARNSTLVRACSSPADVSDYFSRCEAIIAGVEKAMAALHECGYLFVDVSPGNVLVGPDDTVRLVDFEAAHRLGTGFTPTGTPGFSPPRALAGDDPAVYDDYGIAALAQFLIGPFMQVIQRNPDSLGHLRAELDERAPVPQGLWDRATTYHRPGEDPRLPGPAAVAADPRRHLGALRDRVADALVAMADVDHPKRVFPTVVEGYGTNTLCVAYGTAGVLHALRLAGRTAPAGTLERLRRDALATVDELPPGLYVGTAGIARVLADHGDLQEAGTLLAAADGHPLTGACATLFGGSAGVALAHLSMYGHTGDEHHVDRASALVAALPSDADLAASLGPDDATGLLHGRCGIALVLQQLAAVTGDDALLRRGVGLLHAELDRATDPAAAELTFPVSEVDRRTMCYLGFGSAGLAMVMSRYLDAVGDGRLAAAMPRVLAATRLTYTAMPGLLYGVAGMGLALLAHGDTAGATGTARALFKYAIPHDDGVRFLGDQSMRYSADLSSGSAGILLFLSQLLAPRPDPLFTVDALIARR